MIGTNSERREKRRLPVRALEPVRPSVPLLYRLLDISPFGCLIESREPLGEVASPVRLSLPLPKGAAGKPLTARIVWKREQGDGVQGAGYLYGLRFEEGDTASRHALRRYVDFLRRDGHVTGLDEAWRKIRTASKG